MKLIIELQSTNTEITTANRIYDDLTTLGWDIQAVKGLSHSEKLQANVSCDTNEHRSNNIPEASI